MTTAPSQPFGDIDDLRLITRVGEICDALEQLRKTLSP